MLLHVLAAAVALVVAALATPANAQTELAALASGLEAQYRGAIIRERRIADARELALIADAEMRMVDARRVLASARGDNAAARRALESARSMYAQLVNAVELREEAVRLEVQAFRAEIEGRLPAATPGLLAAYQEFADGNRANAWPALETLLRARAEARVAAARAVAAAEVRQLVTFREMMRINGEARARDVIALAEDALELEADSHSVWTLYIRLLIQIGAFSEAQDALLNRRPRIRVDGDAQSDLLQAQGILLSRTELAVELLLERGSASDLDRSADLLFSATFGYPDHSPEVAFRAARQRVRYYLMRQEFERAWTEAVTELARPAYVINAESDADMKLRRAHLALLAADCAWLQGERLILAASQGHGYGSGGLYEQAAQWISNWSERSRIEAHALYADLQRAAPTNSNYQIGLADSMLMEARLLSVIGERRRSNSIFERALSMRRALVAQDPDVIEYQSALFRSLSLLGEVHYWERRIPEARRALIEAEQVARDLSLANPDMFSLRRDHWLSQARLAVPDLNGLATSAIVLQEIAQSFPDEADRAAVIGWINAQPGVVPIDYTDDARAAAWVELLRRRSLMGNLSGRLVP